MGVIADFCEIGVRSVLRFSPESAHACTVAAKMIPAVHRSESAQMGLGSNPGATPLQRSQARIPDPSEAVFHRDSREHPW